MKWYVFYQELFNKRKLSFLIKKIRNPIHPLDFPIKTFTIYPVHLGSLLPDRSLPSLIDLSPPVARQEKSVEEVNCLKLAAKSCGPSGNLSVSSFLN